MLACFHYELLVRFIMYSKTLFKIERDIIVFKKDAKVNRSTLLRVVRFGSNLVFQY